MDRAYDSQSKKFLVKETIPKTESPKQRALTKSIQPATNKKNCSIPDEDTKRSSFSTQPLDEAMQELLDICQQYNDKLAYGKKQQKQQHQLQNSSPNNHSHELNINMKPKTIPATTDDRERSNQTICDSSSRKLDSTDDVVVSKFSSSSSPQYTQNNFAQQPTGHHSRPSDSESIEILQAKQTDLQRQLDEVLLVAKKLASKQKKNHLTDILEENLEIQNVGKTKKDDRYHQALEKNKIEGGDGEEEEEEEDELIEFQQIENELRISDLKRQLDNIQEELRIRLFKRLVSHTSGSKQASSRTSPIDYSPSSSSCSDTTTHSSLNSNNVSNALQSNNAGPFLKTAVLDKGSRKFDVIDGSASERLRRSQDIQVGTTQANNEFQSIANKQPDKTSTTPTKIGSNCSEHDSALDYTEALTPTNSKESVLSKRNPSTVLEDHNMHGPPKETMSLYQAVSPYNLTATTTSPIHSSNHRNNSANSDLERIEEDQEDEQEEQDFYCSSDKFRTIYEEKLSPRALGCHVNQLEPAACRTNLENDTDAHGRQITHSQISDDASKLISSQQLSNSSPHPGRYNVQRKQQPEPMHELTNRPLTLYLPKPDENLDLLEHVQNLGHDIDIISDDLKLSSGTAEGYLWKCCAKNTNKWLRRYFYYDRESQIVAYFKSQRLLTKKHPSPRDTIPFEEISDVYVDHRLSGLGVDKGDGSGSGSSKGRNFVFVLATIGRKYLLATSKAETMRAWIDILFTAAKANDYLEHFDHVGDHEDELDDVNSDSLA